MTEKTKQSKTLEMLSPENFIKEKARKLPVHECWINANWKESQMAQAVLARKHASGNITFCTYLTDLMCLGVKDTYYMFNLNETKYREQIYNISDQMAFVQCDYELIHNIVYSGVKFAEKYGFKPVKDFSTVTKYMLEEEDKVNKIDIECGENGMPLYMRGPFESDFKAKQIVDQLEKSAGSGNYRFVDDYNNDVYGDLEEFWDVKIDDRDIDFENKYTRLNIQEKLALFRIQMVRLESLNKKEKIDFTDLVEAIIEHYLDQEKADEIYDIYFDKLDVFEITDTFHEEMIPPGNLNSIELEKLKIQFADVYELIINDVKEADKLLRALVKKHPENPAVCFLQLSHLRLNKSKKYKSELEASIKKFPDYALIRLLHQINNYVEKTEVSNGLSVETIIETYFPKRITLHRIEMFHVFMFMFVYATKTRNIELLDALDFLMEESFLKDQELELLEYFVTMGKFEFILSKLGKE